MVTLIASVICMILAVAGLIALLGAEEGERWLYFVFFTWAGFILSIVAGLVYIIQHFVIKYW